MINFNILTLYTHEYLIVNSLEMACNLLENMVNNIVDLKINELLTVIHKKYPDKFTKSNLEVEKKYILELPKYTYSLPPFSITSNTSNTSNTLSANNTIVLNKLIKGNDNRKKCTARVWGKIKIDKNTNEIIEIGRQCKNWGNINGYCVKHFNKLTHGDYFIPPTENLIEHFKIKSNIEYC